MKWILLFLALNGEYAQSGTFNTKAECMAAGKKMLEDNRLIAELVADQKDEKAKQWAEYAEKMNWKCVQEKTAK